MILLMGFELLQGELLLATAATEGGVCVLNQTELALPPRHAVMFQQS